MSIDGGGVNYRENLLHKHSDEFLKAYTEKEINEYYKVASTIIRELEQAKERGDPPPLNPETIKLVRENCTAVSRLRNSFISQKCLRDLSTKNTSDFTRGLSLKELEKYIDVATETIDNYKMEKQRGTLSSRSVPDEHTIEAISAKKRS